MSKYQVCDRCDGEGYVSKLGAFTEQDLDEAYGGDAAAREDFVSDYMRRGGPYDERCPDCKGQRVVSRERIAEIEAEYDPEAEAERRYFASMEA